MTTIDAKSLLALRQQILEKNSAFANQPTASQPVDFGQAMTKALDSVNQIQAKSESAAASYERGDTTDIAAVMLQRQKASIAFEATMQVRNKLLSAYKDIMAMPV